MKITNRNITLLTTAFVLTIQTQLAQEIKSFGSCQELISHAKANNITIQNAQLQLNLSDLTTKSSYANILNPVIPTSAIAINNIDQQVSFLPGQAFGQPAGTFKEVTMGQQYAFTFNVQPQFDILNLGSIAQVQTAKINEALVVNQNKINELEIYNRINSTYFNILSFQAQEVIVKEQISNARKIKEIVNNKFNAGVARKQELNEAEVNLLSLEDKLGQLALNIKIQYHNLELLLENEVEIELSESLWDYTTAISAPVITPNNLKSTNALLQKELASSELRTLKFQHTPIVSFNSSFNWQNLSNENFFSANSDWINFSYIGLKIRYEIPTTTQKYANLKTKQIQLEILENNERHIQKENENTDKLLALEMEKALAQKITFEKILALKNDTYQKNFNQFEEGVLALDKLLISQNDLILSQLNMISALANVGYNQTKIEINNDL